MIRPLSLSAALFLAMPMAAPAFAQDAAPGADAAVPAIDASPERINQVVVYGDDPCPASDNGDIVVCGRMSEDERYRIPEPLRGNPNAVSHESWTARVQAVERIGRFGTDSCSPTGLGGFTGCVNALVNNAVAEREQARTTNWTAAVAEARRLRMQGYDAQAAEIEAQVTADEQARIARDQANQAEEAAATAEPLPTPQSHSPLNAPTPH